MATASATRKRSATRPVLGTFSKGIAGSVSLSFDRSGGSNCDTACKYHPKQQGTCYAVRLESRYDRVQLATKLRRHGKMDPADICGRAMAELSDRICRGVSIPWLRISTSGSVPSPAAARANPRFRSTLRALLSFCRSNGIPVHFPVETATKARYYRSLVGDLVTVRESATTLRRFVTAVHAASVTAGQPGTSRTVRVVAAATTAATKRTRSGRKAIVCPAMLHSWASNTTKSNPLPRNPRAKCGACTACAQPNVDVIYPLH